MKRLASIVLFTTLSLTACGKKAEPAPAGTPPATAAPETKAPETKAPEAAPDAAAAAAPDAASPTEAAPDAAAAPAEPIDPPKIDPDYDKALKDIIAGCDVKPETATVTGCKNKEDAAYYALWNEKKKLKTDALDTFAVALVDADPKVSTAAANTMYAKFGTSLLPDAGPVTKSTSGRLIAALAGLSKYQAAQATRTIVHAAMLAGDDERLFAAIAAKNEPGVTAAAYEVLMTHGRTRPLAAMKELAKTAAPDVLAVLASAPRRMPDATPAEKEEVCPWIQELVVSAAPEVAYEAAFSLAWCSDKWLDAMLAEGEKRLADGTFAPPFAAAFREPCASFLHTNRTPEQQAACDKVYDFLEKVGKTETLKPEIRGRALANIAYQERTQPGYDRLKKYAGVADPVVQKLVREALDMLEKSYKLK